MSASETNGSDGRVETSVLEGGVLAALPRTRPQRSSPRRAAARAGTTTKAKKAATKPAAKKPALAKNALKAQTARTNAAMARSADEKPARAKNATEKPATAKKRAPKPTSKAAEPLAPRQGYEPEEEVELGNTVNPPSGVELVESVADIVGELANSSLAAGGRLLKDAFSLLRRP